MAENGTNTIYKTWDDGFLVRRMTRSEAGLAQQWSAVTEVTSCDLAVMLELDFHDSRCYVGELNGEPVACAAIIPVADGLYYGSYLYVKAECRSLGLGRRLRDLAKEQLGDRVLALDAVTELVDMYTRAGSRRDFPVSRFSGKVPATWDMAQLGETIQISPDDLSTLIEYDNLCFIRPDSTQRQSLLRSWLSIPGSACVAAVNTAGDVIGYGCRRPAIEGDNHIIGPLYADTYQAAYSVVHSLCQGLDGGFITIDICLQHQESLQLVATLQLKEDLKMVRMYLNGHPGKLSHRVYGLTSIDVCGF